MQKLEGYVCYICFFDKWDMEYYYYYKIFMYILVSFFFASCGEIYVNMDSIEYSVDKSVYKVNEKIEIKFKGQFYPQDEVMSVNIRLKLNKINDTASDEKDLITEMFVHSINKKEIRKLIELKKFYKKNKKKK